MRRDVWPVMTDKDMFDDAFPQDRQIGGSHYKHFHIQPYEFISKNELSFFQGNVIKYVTRYNLKHSDLRKQREDLAKAKWYLNDLIVELEKKIND